MRLILSCFVLAVSVLAAPQSHAATNVLVPPSDNSSSEQPNLGLGVAPAPVTTPQPPAVARPVLPPSNAANNTTQNQKPPALLEAVGLAPRQTPNPGNRAPVPGSNRPPDGIGIAPAIIQEVDLSRTTGPLAAKLPSKLAVTVHGKYSWGANDVKTITSMLGYPREQIPSHCQLRLDGNATTDKEDKRGLSRAKVFAGQNADIRFDGTLSAVAFALQAVCDPPAGELPMTGRTITKVGGKYAITLPKPLNCATTNNRATALEIDYAGDGTGTCQYR